MQVFEIGARTPEKNKLVVVAGHRVGDSWVGDHSTCLSLGLLPPIHCHVKDLQVIEGVASEAAEDVELILNNVDRGAFSGLWQAPACLLQTVPVAVENLLFAQLVHPTFELLEQFHTAANLLFDSVSPQFEERQGLLRVKHIDSVIQSAAKDWVEGDFEGFVSHDSGLSVHFS